MRMGWPSYFSAEETAAAVSLRHRAGRVRHAGVPVSRAESRAAVRVAAGPPGDRRCRSSRIRATAGCRERSSTASGSGCSAGASSRTRTRWTASRGVPSLLDWLASDFVDSGYDLKRLIATIVTSRAYQLRAVPRTASSRRDYVFRGPEIRRLTAEQFADAIGCDHRRLERAISRRRSSAPRRRSGRAPPDAGAARAVYARMADAGQSAWRARSAGRFAIRCSRAASTTATMLQALELVNGERLSNWLLRGARNMLGELPPPPAACSSRRSTRAARQPDRRRPGRGRAVRRRRVRRDPALARRAGRELHGCRQGRGRVGGRCTDRC